MLSCPMDWFLREACWLFSNRGNIFGLSHNCTCSVCDDLKIKKRDLKNVGSFGIYLSFQKDSKCRNSQI